MNLTELPLAVAFAVLFGGVFSAIELVKRRFGFSPEITRRVAHVAAGFLILLDYLYLSTWWFVLLVSAAMVLLAVSDWLKVATSIHNVKRRTVGEHLLGFGFLGAFAVSQLEPSAFVPSLLIITLADPLAGVTGGLLKRETKTVAGSAVFAVVSFIIIVTTGTLPVLPALGVAVAVALVEAASPYGTDNVTVPVVAASLFVAL